LASNEICKVARLPSSNATGRFIKTAADTLCKVRREHPQRTNAGGSTPTISLGPNGFLAHDDGRVGHTLQSAPPTTSLIVSSAGKIFERVVMPLLRSCLERGSVEHADLAWHASLPEPLVRGHTLQSAPPGCDAPLLHTSALLVSEEPSAGALAAA